MRFLNSNQTSKLPAFLPSESPPLPFLCSLDRCRRVLAETAERGHAGPVDGAQVELVLVVKVDGAQRAALGRRADAAAGHGVGVAGKGLAVGGKGVGVAGKGRGDVDAGVEGVDGVLAAARGIGAGAEEKL